MVITTTSGTNYVVETLDHLGTPTLAFYSVENNRRPPLMLFRDSQSLRFAELQLATPDKISAQLVAPDVTLLITDIDSESVSFSLIGNSLSNSEAVKVLFDAASVKKTMRLGEVAERDRLLAEVKAAELKAKQEADAKVAAELKAKQDTSAKVAAKKSTIICVKGKLIKKVTAVKPVCPSGYKKK
jgi:hypothetical protein